jgi:hypothetical protein
MAMLLIKQAFHDLSHLSCFWGENFPPKKEIVKIAEEKKNIF